VPTNAEDPHFAGGGESGALIRAFDWSKTPLGPIEHWSHSLKNTVGIMLHSRQPMFLWWGPSLIQLYNDAYVPSFGKGKHPASLGQPGAECWQEIWPIIWPQIETVMTRGEPSWHEDHLVPIFRNGRLEEVYWTYGYSAVFDDDGRIGGTLVISTETTARVLSERRQRRLGQLAKSMMLATSSDEIVERAMAALGDAADDIPFALAYRFDQTNGTATLLRSTGLSSDASRALCPFVEAQLPNMNETHPRWVGTIPAPHADGPTQAFIAALTPSPRRETWAFVVLAISPKLSFDELYRDYFVQISQQLQLAQTHLDALHVRAVTESERNNLLLQAPVATAVMMGPKHEFKLTNALFTKMAGRAILLGRTYAEAFPELADTPLSGILDRVYQTGEPFFTNELMLPVDRTGDGAVEDAYFKFNLEAMRDLDGNVYGMMAVAMEVTQQVRARQALERTQVEREKLVAELEHASRTKDEFLAMLGHEMRNPLAPIVSALEIMKAAPAGRAQSLKAKEVLERHVSHLVRLVDDLLDVSKITRGKIELRKQLVDVSDVLARAQEMVSFIVEQRGHQLSVTCAPGLKWYGDPVRLAQAVANLLTNAARYTQEHGHIGLRAAHEGGDVVLRVKDDGKGMSAELLPRVFELFFQAARSADRSEGGLGIGLSLVKNLVELHGGTVTAHSEGTGQGSEFVIRLPAPTAEAIDTPAPAHPLAAVCDARAKRVLVVDDNADAADLLSMLLEQLGHEVAVANDSRTAISLAASFAPDVAVLDIGLPEMDGYELAAHLRGRSSLRLVALTGYGGEQDRTKSADAGFDMHLVKPVDVDTLVSIFGRVG
jgi:signal transduction histidine kinase